MGKRVILNRSGVITAARPGADPTYSLNRPTVSADAAARADAAEAKVLRMGREVADLLVELSDLKRDYDVGKQNLKTALDKCGASAAGVSAAEKKADRLETDLGTVEADLDDVEAKLTTAVKRAETAEKKVAALEARLEAAETKATPASKKTTVKKPACRKKKPSSS